MPQRRVPWNRVLLLLTIAVIGWGDERATNSNTDLSLEELKSVGARRSEYLQARPPVELSAPEADLATFEVSVQPILERTCHRCHGPEKEKGNLRIDTLDPDLVGGEDVDWWVEVLSVLTNGEMPPPKRAKLSGEDRRRVIDWLSSEVQRASAARRASGGHSSFRRLTRYEYRYALEDLLGLPWDFAKDLPPEARSEEGFQNSSALLHMSVGQLETYRQLARRALERATVRGERPPVLHWRIPMVKAAAREWPQQEKKLREIEKKFEGDPEKRERELEKQRAAFSRPHSRAYYRALSTGRTAVANWGYNGARYAFAPTEKVADRSASFDQVAVLPPSRNRGLIVELGDRLPDEGRLRVRVRASRSSNDDVRPPSLQLHFGFQSSNEGKADVRVSERDTPIDAPPESPAIYEWKVALGEIYPRNAERGVTPLGKTPSPSEYLRFVNSSVGEGDLQIDYVEVAAPVYDEWPPRSHRRIFLESENRGDEAAYAREVLTAFLSRAWRGTATAADIDRKLRLFEAMRETAGSFEEAMVEVLATVLSSPRFLYVVQEGARESGGGKESEPGRISPAELATRLALFLWSSVPDRELLELATSGALARPEVLSRQVARMLADRRSERFSRHFVRQWLDLELLDFVRTGKQSRRFDPALKEAMQREPIAFFRELLAKNESVLNLIHSDFTMANERLAQHYGLRGVHGNHFRRVPLEPSHRRGGILTQAGLLAMNSDGKDSHPVKRGVWLLKSVLNDPPPPPPPAVPEIDLADPEVAKLTLKEQIEDHRNHPACMSCHAKIDPWGIAFENFDALGRWRDEVQGQPVDAVSRLPSDAELNGMDGLKRHLLSERQDQFVRGLVHKLATYALGRPLSFSDRSGVEAVTREARRKGDGLATMIELLARSELFQSE